MKQRGSIAGFLIGKLAVFIAVALLFCSITTSYRRINRTTERKKIDKVMETLVKNLREVDSLPGQIRIERNLPPLSKPYKLILSGNYRDYQIVRIQVQTQERFQRIITLRKIVCNGKFRIERENPERFTIAKSDRIQLEVF